MAHAPLSGDGAIVIHGEAKTLWVPVRVAVGFVELDYEVFLGALHVRTAMISHIEDHRGHQRRKGLPSKLLALGSCRSYRNWRWRNGCLR